MGFIILLLTILVPFCLAGESCSKESCDCGIDVKWKNELGSTMTLTCKDGQLEGIYNTGVGQAKYDYTLSGRYTLSGPKNDVVELGWVVSWNNKLFGKSNSATSWSGIYYPEDGIIQTQWMLVRYAERKDYWSTTQINHDEFERVK